MADKSIIHICCHGEFMADKSIIHICRHGEFNYQNCCHGEFGVLHTEKSFRNRIKSTQN